MTIIDSITNFSNKSTSSKNIIFLNISNKLNNGKSNISSNLFTITFQKDPKVRYIKSTFEKGDNDGPINTTYYI